MFTQTDAIPLDVTDDITPELEKLAECIEIVDGPGIYPGLDGYQLSEDHYFALVPKVFECSGSFTRARLVVMHAKIYLNRPNMGACYSSVPGSHWYDSYLVTKIKK
jgi:hypothetical protein